MEPLLWCASLRAGEGRATRQGAEAQRLPCSPPPELPSLALPPLSGWEKGVLKRRASPGLEKHFSSSNYLLTGSAPLRDRSPSRWPVLTSALTLAICWGPAWCSLSSESMVTCAFYFCPEGSGRVFWKVLPWTFIIQLRGLALPLPPCPQSLQCPAQCWTDCSVLSHYK